MITTCRSLSAVLLALGLVLTAGIASSALADDPTGNGNPIDWTVDTPFGVRHIVDAHGAVPPPQVIDNVLQTGNCTGAAPRFSCKTQEAVVAFATSVDPCSGDNLPFGIITAFFKALDPGCGC